MGYYLQMDRTTYDDEHQKVLSCSGISEAIVLKILDSVTIAAYEIKIYKEIEDNGRQGTN